MAVKEKLVINLEPFEYSEKAKSRWIEKGFTYISSGWDIPSMEWQKGEAIIVRLGRYVGKKELDMFPALKTIMSATTGLDHLDLMEIEKRGIRLICLRGEKEFLKTIPSTAEHTWALLGALVRKIPASANSVKEGYWNRDDFRGTQLRGKTLGIIGLGRTGSLMARYASAFEMKVIYFDPFVIDSPFERCETLHDLFSTSDIITIHVHLEDNTRGMITDSILGKAKKGVYLLNTSRGGLWDEVAIVKRLEEGIISGVAADVLDSELRDLRESALWKAQEKGLNVIITPHLGGATYEAMWACEEYLVSKVE